MLEVPVTLAPMSKLGTTQVGELTYHDITVDDKVTQGCKAVRAVLFVVYVQ